jgi:hypothetical protein
LLKHQLKYICHRYSFLYLDKMKCMNIKITLLPINFILLFCLTIFISYSIFAQGTIPTADTNRLVIIFAGDIMGHDEQIKGAYDSLTGRYNYEPVIRYIKDYLSEADIAVGNLEVTLAGPPYKGYPQFSSPDELVVDAKDAGFDILATANNHALDGGIKGFVRTLKVLDSLEFLHIGTYRDSVERAQYFPLVFEKNEIRIALLNYTYGTNGLNIPHPCLINRIDTLQIKMDIEKAHQAKADFVLVFIHWGIEYERVENADQKGLASFIFRIGADAIIGSHPHVVQPIQYFKLAGDTNARYPVVYSLGNFVSNQRAQYKDGGIIAELHFSKTESRCVIDSVMFLPYWVGREDNPGGKSTFFVLPVSKYEIYPEVVNLNDNDIFRLNRFATDTRKHLEEVKESDYYLKKQELQ